MVRIARVVLCIAILALIPGPTTIGMEPEGFASIPDAIGSHAPVKVMSSSFVAAVDPLRDQPEGPLPPAAREPGIPSVTPDRPGEHLVTEKDALLEPGTLLLFGMGLIALTYGWKYQMFKR